MENFKDLTDMENLKDLTDYELVKMVQKEADQYRKQCFWYCNTCQSKISYLDSLLLTGLFCVYDFRCINDNGKRKCNKKMVLVNKDHFYFFNSIYFNELFSRYKHFLINESKGCQSIDAPEEVYSEFLVSFFKIVFKFARESGWKEKSKKWFSSFLWQSLQHKIADMKKTNNYAKRSPRIICECCKKPVGQITKKHLISEGHNEIINEIYRTKGYNLIYSTNQYATTNQCIKIGKKYIDLLDEKSKKNYLLQNAMEAYKTLYPNSFFKNKIVSIHEKIKEEYDDEMDEFLSDHKSQQNKIIEDIEMENRITLLTDYILKNYDLKDYFYEKKLKTKDYKGVVKSILDKYIQNFYMTDDLDKYIHEIENDFKNYVKPGTLQFLLEKIKMNCRSLVV